MITRFTTLILAVVLILSLAGPASAQTTGSDTLRCAGDGTIVFSGDFASLSVSTVAGALVYNKPGSGKIVVSAGTTFKKYTSGNNTLYIGSGSGTAANVKGIKLTLSGADATLYAVGKGTFAVRGVGTCTTSGGKTYTWTGEKDISINVSP